MQKFLISILFVFSVASLKAQIPEGFNSDLAKDLIRLCNSYTFTDLYDSDKEIIPESYKLFYTSKTQGLDNKFQVYLTDTLAIFNFRGSTADPKSWLENLHSAMIPANDIIKIKNEYFNYSFAKDSNASVHGGYALGLAYIYKDVFNLIDSLNYLGYYNILITGHSQGGALSNLLRALIENMPEERFSNKNRFITYAFAAPMVGNRTFVKEYNERYCKSGTSFNIVNPSDGIPKLPSSFDDSTKIIYNNVVLYFTEPANIDIMFLIRDVAYLFFGKMITDHIQKVGQSIIYEVSKDKGQVILPKYTNEINYYYLGNVVYLPPVSYPIYENDSLILENRNYRTTYSVWDNEKFFNKKNTKSEPGMFQHKPYNYYIAILLKFFPEDYQKLEKKFLPENL